MRKINSHNKWLSGRSGRITLTTTAAGLPTMAGLGSKQLFISIYSNLSRNWLSLARLGIQLRMRVFIIIIMVPPLPAGPMTTLIISNQQHNRIRPDPKRRPICRMAQIERLAKSTGCLGESS